MNNSRRNFLKKASATALGTAAIASTAEAKSYDKEVTFQHGDGHHGIKYDYRMDVIASSKSDATKVGSYTEGDDYIGYDQGIPILNPAQDRLWMAGFISGNRKDRFKYNGSFLRYHTFQDTWVNIWDNDPDKRRRWQMEVRGDGRYTILFYGDREPWGLNTTEGNDDTDVVGGYGWIDGEVLDGGSDSYEVYGDIKEIRLSGVSNYMEIRFKGGDYNMG
ncbi:twin-arginine translocation signal domain-containing protein [Haladaptatus caseinilyticus]|uniref:twin-arginine translocation signal domain-containing protein n=1 Tax=Haladaptatus caseinilyticus TaxID=2993314 RepID=UPI00224B7E57|nr:twin-arginine translocation signal domain-containing protein [Haladaptatus caseinilyticus]